MTNRGDAPDRVQITVGLDEDEDEASLRRAIRQQCGNIADGQPIRLLKRSLDARKGQVRFHLLVEVGESKATGGIGLGEPHPVATRAPARVLIVGDGPAGLFAAYQLARRGVRSVVIDRGKPVQPRRRDLKLLNARGGLDPESNYCFGEGGAGTYSDGKLYTRSHKRGPVRDVMEILALHGAPAAILTEARPHIGSNLLPQIVSSMRERLEGCGVEFRFRTKLTALQVEAGRFTGAQLVHGDEALQQTSHIEADAAVVATGHSARDVFAILEEAGARLEFKPFALGVRIEHPQELINRIQFGRHARHPKLGAASYKLVQQVAERGVFSFCMCPGGWIVPAMTEPGHLVVNGMSLSKRDSPFANSGLVVSVEEQELQHLPGAAAWRGVELQRKLEALAWEAGGGRNRAPGTRATDFVAKRASRDLPATSYLPGLEPGDVGALLEATLPGLADKLRQGLLAFDQRMRGYVSEQAVLVGVESRTSSPIRVVRHPESMEASGVSGLFPAGEGAGYAGGIVSAAVDGFRVAERIAAQLGAACR